MPGRWVYQVRGKLRGGMGNGIASDLAGLVRNAAGASNALVLPRSRHDLPTHLPYAFAEGIPDGMQLRGPGFGPRLGYDGRRFDGLTGARVEAGELLLGIRAEALDQEIRVIIDGFSSVPHVSRLAALLDFLAQVLAGPPGEVVGRMHNEHHAFGHPLVRCADGRIRLVHVSGLAQNAGPGATLPELISPECVEFFDDSLGDLDEDALRRWLAVQTMDAAAP